MKPILFTIFVCVLMYACTEKKLTKQEIAELKIRQYLNQNLDDTTSYQPVSFSKLTNDSTDIVDTFSYDHEGNAKREKVLKDFKPELKGFYVVHKFRAKNKLNAIVLNSNIFYLDTALNITSVE